MYNKANGIERTVTQCGSPTNWRKSISKRDFHVLFIITIYQNPKQESSNFNFQFIKQAENEK